MAKIINELCVIPAGLPSSFYERHNDFEYTESQLILKLHQYEVYNIKINYFTYETLICDTELGAYIDDLELASDLITRYFMSLSVSSLMGYGGIYSKNETEVKLVGLKIHLLSNLDDYCPCIHCTDESHVDVECSECDHNEYDMYDNDEMTSIAKRIYVFSIQGVSHMIGCSTTYIGIRALKPQMYWYR